ncbi:hypothetical protein [Streptomyces cinereoruber]|uniref:hypothetical protein n=1 Tax=Streptomyces cinereoruber TaxID=67260 RepID=UPI003C2EB890
MTHDDGRGGGRGDGCCDGRGDGCGDGRGDGYDDGRGVGYGDLEETLRAALTRGARPEVEPAALAAFRAARHAAPPTRRRDDWTPVADRRRGGRPLRTVLAGLFASVTLGGVALAAGDLPDLLEDRPLPAPARPAEPTAPGVLVPHPPPVRPEPRPRPSRAVPPEAEEPDREAPGRGKENGDGPGRGRGADRGTKNGWQKDGRTARPAEKPGKGPDPAGSTGPTGPARR